MGISVGHDVNQGMYAYDVAYGDALNAQRLRALGPYGGGSVQAQNAALAGNPAEIAAKKARRAEGKEPDTSAGFDWQTPIQVEHGNGTEDTLYQSQGVDPLANAAGVAGASAGFGKLGSREQTVYDNANVINPNDPNDRAKVGRLTQDLPYGTNFQDADYFRSDKEKQDIADAKKQAEFDRQQKLKSGLELSRQMEKEGFEKAQKDAQTNARIEGHTADIQNRLDAGVNADQATWDDNSAESSDVSGIKNDTEFTPYDQRRREDIRNRMSALSANQSIPADSKEAALYQMQKDLDSIKPVPVEKKPKEQAWGQEFQLGNGQWAQRNNQTGELKIIHGAEVKPEKSPKPDYTDGEYQKAISDAHKQLRDEQPPQNYNYRPSRDEVLKRASENLDVLRDLKRTPTSTTNTPPSGVGRMRENSEVPNDQSAQPHAALDAIPATNVPAEMQPRIAAFMQEQKSKGATLEQAKAALAAALGVVK